ncbi:unnamed protein product [Symbiodinium sp. CCMP2592]|nr:unnamed protein product [Symbiodinium sp. CCMP2592]
MTATKKRAVGKQAEPQPVGTIVPVNNPTLLKIAEGMKLLVSCSCRFALTDVRSNRPMMFQQRLPHVVEFMKNISPATPAGGIQEFSLDDYRASMKSVQNYTCVVPVTAIPPYATVHSGLIPSLASIKNVQDTFWSEEGPGQLMFSESISVVAWSANERPGEKELVPLDKDSYRMGFWFSLFEAESPNRLDALRSISGSMRVTFVLVSSREDMERKRWKLSSSSSALAENMVLLGYKRLLAIYDLKESLKSWGKDASDRVSAWLEREKIYMKESVIASICRIRKRMAEAKADIVMDQVEEILKVVDHPLAKTGTLEKLTSMTKLANAPLQNELLLFVVSALMVLFRSKTLGLEATRETLVQHARAALLARRIINYMLMKLKPPGPAEENPRSPAGFHKNFLSFENFESSRLADECSDHTWLAGLYGYQREALPQLKQFLVGDLQIYSVLIKLCDNDPLVPAEVALQQTSVMKLVTLKELLDMREKELRPPEDEPAPPSEPAEPAPVTIEEPEKKAEEAGIIQEQEEIPPVMDEEARAPIPEPDNRAMFPSVIVADFQLDLLKQMEAPTLAKMKTYADMRRKLSRATYVNLSIVGNNITSIKGALMEAAAGWPAGIFHLDGKCFGGLSASAAAPMNFYRQYLAFLFDPDSGAFREEDLLIVSPGNSQKAYEAAKRGVQKSAKELWRHMKASPIVCQRRGLQQIRLMNTNKERLRGSFPDPLETVLLLKGKQCTLPSRERKHLDLPGCSKDSGIANLRMKTVDEMALLVRKSVWEENFSKVLAASTDEGGDEEAQATDTAAEPVLEGPTEEVVQFCLFERPEMVCREWINLFGEERSPHTSVQKQSSIMIDFSPGAGSMALACARDLHVYYGLCFTASQRDVIFDSIRLTIMLELIMNKRNGFSTSRFLSRERSLGGTSATASMTSPADTDSKARSWTN